MSVSLEQFAKGLSASGLMTAEEIKAFHSTLAPEKRKDAPQFATELVRQGKLTRFQAASIYQGNTANLVMGDYRVLELIGTGGMGQVFKAEHRRMKRIVALKLLPAEVVKDAQAVKRFQREVETAARLIHPNIVTAYDAGEQHGVHYLIMEYVDGQDLSSLIKKQGTLPIETAVNFVAQAARGLEHAHGEGVIHRDIKPANLLVDRKGTIKILDMGLARADSTVASHDKADAVDGLTNSGVIMGTVDYMSPEQAIDTRQADHRSDVYSLGCTLFYLLTGRRMFEGDTLMKRILAHRDHPPPLLASFRPDMPATLETIFARMVAKQPEERYQSMAAVRHAMESLLAKMEGADDSSSVLHIEKVADEDLASFLRGMKAQADVGTHAHPRLTSETANILDLETRADSHSHKTASGRRTSKRRLIAAVTVVGAVALVALAVMLLNLSPSQPPVARTSIPPAVPPVTKPTAPKDVSPAPGKSRVTPTTKRFDTPVQPPLPPEKPAEPAPVPVVQLPEKPIARAEPNQPKRIIVGPGPGEIHNLASAIEQAQAGDTIAVRHRGPLPLPPVDLDGKSPLTIEGDRQEEVDFWPLIVLVPPPSESDTDPPAPLTSAPAHLFAKHLDLTLRKLHLATAGPATKKFKLGAVFSLERGALHIEDCCITVGGESPGTGPAANVVPFVQSDSASDDTVEVHLQRSFVRGPALSSCLAASGAGEITVHAEQMLWAGAAMPWLDAKDLQGVLRLNLDHATLYNVPNVLRWNARNSEAKAQFTTRHSLFVAPYTSKEPFVRWNPDDAQADFPQAVTEGTFSWQADGNVYHRFEGFYREPRTRALASLTKWRALWGQTGVMVERESDPHFRVWPSDYVLQEATAWDFEPRFWRNREKTRQIAESIGADVSMLPAALARCFNRTASPTDVAIKPRGVPRTLRVHQRDGPYKSIEAALTEVTDGDIVEIADDGPYTPRRNFALNLGDGVLVSPVACLTLRAARNASPVIVLRDEIQEGSPGTMWVGPWMVHLAASHRTSVVLDGLHFRMMPAATKYRATFAAQEVGLMRASNCSFSVPLPASAMYFAGAPSVFWLENCAFFNTGKNEEEMVRINTKPHAAPPAMLCLLRNCLFTGTFLNQWTSSTSPRTDFHLGLFNNTFLGRIGNFTQTSSLTTEGWENLVVSPEAVFKFDDDNIWRNAMKRGDRNALWIGNRPLTDQERVDFANNLLPGPPLKVPPTFETAVGVRDPLRRFRVKRANVLAADGANVGVRMDYMPDIPAEN